MFFTRCQRSEQSTARSDKMRIPCNETKSGPTTTSIPTTSAKERRRMSKFRLLSARILILSSRAYLLAWETGRRPVVINGAKVLGHVISERRPAGSESEARHVLGIAAFLPGSALSDGTFSCFPLSLSRSARRPCKPRALCDREIIVLPASKTNDFDTSPCRCAF